MYEGGNGMDRKFDSSELYDYIKANINTYVISFDMKGLMPINDTYGSEAGDKAILECLKRIDSVADKNMVAFRIGGDEFVLCTGLSDKDKVGEIAAKILAFNGGTVEQDGIKIPVAMRAGAAKIQGRNVRYSELFTKLNEISRPKNDKTDGVSCYFED